MITTYTVLTSFNKTYWQEIAQDNVRKIDQLWPESENILLYHQLSEIDTSFSNRVQWIDLYQSCPELIEFSDRWKDDLRANGKSGKKNAFRQNAIKFCHKTFAIWHAARQQKNGWLIWLDCDAIVLKKIDNEFITTVCPDNKCISYIGRKGKYSECGFVGYNLDRPETRKFLELWENFYLSGEFINHSETHDSWTFDYIRKLFDNPDLFCDLNAASTTDKNPFGNSLIGTHIVHAKGADKIKTTAKLKKQIK
jgi:hypothetical protein